LCVWVHGKQHFGIKEDKVPAIVVEGTGTSRQSIGLDIKASELAHWLQDYLVQNSFFFP
jgi:hypothetical protein